MGRIVKITIWKKLGMMELGFLLLLLPISTFSLPRSESEQGVSLQLEKNTDGDSCCEVLYITTSSWAVDKEEFKLTTTKYNNKPVYRGEGQWDHYCIFFSHHWNFDQCDLMDTTYAQSLEYGSWWTKSKEECPGDVGPVWRRICGPKPVDPDCGPKPVDP